MKLPDIEYGPVQGSAQTAAAPYDAAAGLTKVIAQGLQAYGQELVKTQHQEAAINLAERLNAVENGIKARKEMSQDEVKAAFGDSVPEQARGYLDKKDPVTGEPIPIPMWAIGDALYNREARKALDEATGTITMGGGWKADFQAKAMEHVVQRQQHMAQYQLHALDQYLQHTQLQQVERLRNAGAFDQADQVVMDALPFEVRQAERQKTEVARQLRPALEALSSENPAEIKTQLDRLRSDQRAVTAIPADTRKTAILHLEERWKKYEAVGLASQAFEAGLTPGSRVFDEQKMLDSLSASGKGRSPALQAEARTLLKQRILDSKEERLNETSKVFAVALQAFQAPNAKGEPTFKTALVPPEARAYLTDPANGKEAADLWNSLLAKEQSAEMHGRSLAEKPTEANWREYAILTKDMNDNPGKYRAMAGDRFTADVYGKIGPLVKEAMSHYKAVTEQKADARHLSGDERAAVLESLPLEFRPSRTGTNPDSEKGKVWKAVQEAVAERKGREWDDKKGAVPQGIIRQWTEEEWAKGTVKGGKLWGLLDANNVPKAVAGVRYPDKPWVPNEPAAGTQRNVVTPEVPVPGQPVKVKSKAEADALAPGTVFITPDGRRKVR